MQVRQIALFAIAISCLTITISVGCNLINRTFYTESAEATRAISKVLSNFQTFSVLIHYDETSKDLVADLSLNLSSTVVMVQTYGGETLFERPSGDQFVNIVLLEDPLAFGHFAKVTYNTDIVDVVLFVVYKDFEAKIKSILRLRGISSAGLVLILNLNPGGATLAKVCFYCGTEGPLLTNLSLDESLALHDFYDFHGYNFRIAYTPFMPFFDCREKVVNGKLTYTLLGCEGNVLKLLSEKLNFTYTLINFSNYTNNIWTEMVREVSKKTVDWAVSGISVSLPRAEMTDFTKSFWIERYVGLYSVRNDPFESWAHLILPFSLIVWLFILLTIVVVGLAMRYSNLIFGSRVWDRARYFMTLSRYLIEQCDSKAQEIFGTRISQRLLLAIWCLMAISITAAYKSQLASWRIKSNVKEPNSLLELLNKDYYFQVNHQDWTFLREGLENAYDTKYKTIANRCLDDLHSMCLALERIDAKRVAIIDEGSFLQYEIMEHCKVNLADHANLRITRNQYLYSSHNWPIQRGAAYVIRFSTIIKNLHSAGLLDYWHQNVVSNQIPLSNAKQQSKTTQPLEISNILAALFLFFIGILLSVGVFCFEVISNKVYPRIHEIL